MNSTSSPTSSRARPNSKIIQNRLWYPSNGIFGNDHWSGKSGNGWKEAGSHLKLETTHFGEGCTILHWIHKFLQEVHPKLFWYHCPLKSFDMKERTLELDSSPTKSVQETQKHLFLHPSPPDPWCRTPLFHHDRCFPTCGRGGPSADRYQWRPPPLCFFPTCSQSLSETMTSMTKSS